MNWEAIGSIGEIIGALAVVGTLGYVALQIRQQNAATNLQVNETVLSGFDEPLALLAADLERAALFNRGLADPESLSDDEAAQFSSLFRLFMNQYLKIHRLYLAGVLSEPEWINYATSGGYLARTPGGQRFCETQGAFKEFLEILLGIPDSDSAISFSLGRRY